MKAQVALEFLMFIGISLLLFTIILIVYFDNSAQAFKVRESLEAQRLCMEVASTISSFSAMGGSNSSYSLNLTENPGFENHTIYIVSNSSRVRVDYLTSGMSCALRIKNITNTSGSTLFVLQRNATLFNNNGVIMVVQ